MINQEYQLEISVNYEPDKDLSTAAKGVAILAMVMLHLFCRNQDLPYKTLINLNQTPLIYYFGLFGDICVPIYCFISGYAQMLIYQKNSSHFLNRGTKQRLIKFYINYLVVILMFSLFGLMIGSSFMPGSLLEFIGNISLVNMSYNGAWWFVLTYIFLVLLTPFFARIVNKYPTLLTFIASGLIYFISYIFRIMIPIQLPNKVLAWVFRQLLLIGTSQFSFIVGMICFRYKVITKIKVFLIKKKWLMPICLILPILLFIGHGIVPSMIIAPINGISVLICFYIFPLPTTVKRVFLFFGQNSTNIWLTHMFFYTGLLDGFVFKAQYPICIFLFTIALSLISSYIIKFFLSLMNNKYNKTF